ncbi:helix-turn-helix domain-containing protein [Actinoplanes sp. GCM10030250]|uniref:helix-turn-helix domain-containing protein n=1 Tax=Actinoplanes sp. GCM10030250 TaxID=3273376 RepID=UPI00360CFC41
MTEATDLAAAASSADPRVGLRAVVALRRLLEGLERLQVANARSKDWSWQEIADALEVTRQGVHKKHAKLMPMPDPRES